KEQEYFADFNRHPLLELDLLTQLYNPHCMLRGQLRYIVFDMSLKKSCGHFLFIFFLCAAVHAETFKYMRIGNKEDVQTKASPGTAMMGGGSDLDEAFRWLCTKANGGDFLILRARGDDDYNKYVNGLCKVNSVATLVIPDRKAALDPAVADIIRHAEAI